MNLVSFALRRPISLLTMVIAVALVGFLVVDRMPRDIFPDIGVPVLYVAQPYGGMDPAQVEGFIRKLISCGGAYQSMSLC
ncbi:efflux RND transporter permease subunit [Bradyrhizobium sp. 187]|jgi:multidrug efflux pump subunit AcrB|uniref:efflux RND transporter permease subunit n=1 Tax=Bradyrhizobium sp. 187 TaxID=2782655 RepID=UPI001FFF0EDC|nr:efflux RND transporter permease subunit [Bradyrhizobium sp. 187]UPJ71924.1 efflux RND transporter permease subunit [Bradyrhizobium sp. 187]